MNGFLNQEKTHLNKYKINMICTWSVVSQPVLAKTPHCIILSTRGHKRKRRGIQFVAHTMAEEMGDGKQ